MIRLTLTDGTRIQLPAAEISAVEPFPAGALVYRTSGEVLTVLQDFRTVETRVNAEWMIAERDAMPQEAKPDEPAPAPQPLAELPVRRSETPSHRRKRLLLGRTSAAAIFIARRLR